MNQWAAKAVHHSEWGYRLNRNANQTILDLFLPFSTNPFKIYLKEAVLAIQWSNEENWRNPGESRNAKYDALVLCESAGEIWNVIALGFIFVDKVPLWWIHQRGVLINPKMEMMCINQFLSLICKVKEAKVYIFQYHFNCRQKSQLCYCKQLK